MAASEQKPLGQLLERPPKYGINAALVTLKPGIPTYIRITDIDGNGRYAPNPKVGVSHPDALDFRLAEGELVFARTGASVGKSYLYDPHDGELVYAGFLINIAPDKRQLNPSYLSLYAQTKEYWNWVARTSMRSGQPGINSREYSRLPVPVPDITTQNLIAEKMADVDALIACLEQVTTKKQAIKQGMMQELLTGKTRLFGFTERWQPVSLRELGATYGGLSGKTKDDFGHGSAQYVTFMEVMAGPLLRGERLERVRVSTSERQNRVLRGDILFNGSSETPEEVALAAAVDFDPAEETYLNSFCFGYRAKRSGRINPTYLAFFFRSSSGRNLISSLAQGATRYNIAKSKFLDLAPELPLIEEQNAITSVLVDAEREVDALRTRLQKAKAIKQGMMQELLSGRTRLPITEVAS